MNLNFLKNNFSRNRLNYIIVVILIAATVALFSCAVMLSLTLSSSISSMMEKSQTPHLLQMHVGEFDEDDVIQFAENERIVESYQIVEMSNIESHEITFESGSLADSLQQQLLTVQSPNFDFLLDKNNQPISLEPGEISLPLTYESTQLAPGDTVTLFNHELSFIGFHRDAQMNANLSSSKRILVHESDYETLKSHGLTEYMISFRLSDLSHLNELENAYSNNNLPSNGPMITNPLIMIINFLSEGIIVAVLALVSFLILLIGMICMFLILRKELEQDFTDIGILKTLGFNNNDVKKLYLFKFSSLIIVGFVLGLIGGLIIYLNYRVTIEHQFGHSSNMIWITIIGLIAGVVISFLMLIFVQLFLRKIKNISMIDAIRNFQPSRKVKTTQRFSNVSNPNHKIVLTDLSKHKGYFATLIIIVILVVMILVFPYQLHHTLSGNSFIKYMGVGDYDLIVQPSYDNENQEEIMNLHESIKSDERIEFSTLFLQQSLSVNHEEIKRILVESGNHQLAPINYVSGTYPDNDEIALSEMMANEMQLTVGDELEVYYEGEYQPFVVSGIYSDITNGGKTGKITTRDSTVSVMRTIMAMSFVEEDYANEVIGEYLTRLENVEVISIDEYFENIYGETVTAIERVGVIAMIIGVLTLFVIVALYMNLRISMDRFRTSVLITLGFRYRDIDHQYLIQSLSVVLLGTFLGLVATHFVSEFIIRVALSLVGASTFKLESSIWYMLFTAGLILVVAWIAVELVTKQTRKLNLSQWIKE